MKKTLKNGLLSILNQHLRNPERTDSKAIVWNDGINRRLNSIYSLQTNDNEHDLEGFKINFDWNIEKWYVYV